MKCCTMPRPSKHAFMGSQRALSPRTRSRRASPTVRASSCALLRTWCARSALAVVCTCTYVKRLLRCPNSIAQVFVQAALHGSPSTDRLPVKDAASDAVHHQVLVTKPWLPSTGRHLLAAAGNDSHPSMPAPSTIPTHALKKCEDDDQCLQAKPGWSGYT